eukprot:6417601-Pyramimonas_sp.AAC.1
MATPSSGANGMLPDSDAHKTDLVTLHPRDFFHKIVNGDPDGHRYYFTAPVMNLTPKLMPQVEDWPSLDLQQGKGVEPWKCIRPYLSVWIGGKDVTTQAHYDVVNNVFVQAGVATLGGRVCSTARSIGRPEKRVVRYTNTREVIKNLRFSHRYLSSYLLSIFARGWDAGQAVGVVGSHVSCVHPCRNQHREDSSGARKSSGATHPARPPVCTSSLTHIPARASRRCRASPPCRVSPP